jgi:putative CocE/NonD family hydrolase
MDSPSAAYGDAVRHIEHLWITLSDGRRLAARLWLPADAEARPVPAILEYLPYRKRDGTAARDEINYPAFARAGYAGLRVDMAGSGDSDGRLTDEYSEDELASGAEVIAWIAAQSWCSGAVGMIGISWGGFNGLQIAMRRPLALKAVVSVCSTVDRYADDIHFMGGSLLTDNFNWAAQMTAYMTRPPDPLLRDDWREVWLQRIESLPFLAVEWLKHQRRDAYWKHGSVCEDWRAIDCPVLAIGGWADAYSDTPARLLEGLSAPVRALVGPWEHEYPNMARIAPAADFHGEVGRWFDRWLKGEDNGVEARPAYRVYLQSFDPPHPSYDAQPGRWVAEPAWPSPNIAPRVLHLAEGRLRETPGEGAVTVASPQDLGDTAGLFCPGMRVDNDLAGDQGPDDALSVCFDGAALSEAVEVLGAPQVELELACDCPQALLVLRLCDVAPDGGSMRVSYLPFNLTHRARTRGPGTIGVRSAVPRQDRIEALRAPLRRRPPHPPGALDCLLAGRLAAPGKRPCDPTPGELPADPAGARRGGRARLRGAAAPATDRSAGGADAAAARKSHDARGARRRYAGRYLFRRLRRAAGPLSRPRGPQRRAPELRDPARRPALGMRPDRLELCLHPRRLEGSGRERERDDRDPHALPHVAAGDGLRRRRAGPGADMGGSGSPRQPVTGPRLAGRSAPDGGHEGPLRTPLRTPRRSGSVRNPGPWPRDCGRPARSRPWAPCRRSGTLP